MPLIADGEMMVFRLYCEDKPSISFIRKVFEDNACKRDIRLSQVD